MALAQFEDFAPSLETVPQRRKLGKYMVGGYLKVYIPVVRILILYNTYIILYRSIYYTIIVVYYFKMTYLLIDDLGNIIGYNYFD